MGVCPATRKLEPNSGGRTPGSQTPGVPAPRQPTTVGHRGLPPWHSTSSWTECEKCRKMRRNTFPDVAAWAQGRPHPRKKCTCGNSTVFSTVCTHELLELVAAVHKSVDHLQTFSALPDTGRCTTPGASNNLTQKTALRDLRFSAEFALCVPFSVAQLEVQQSGDVLNLRHHLTVDRQGLLELEQHDHKDVNHRSPEQHGYLVHDLLGSVERARRPVFIYRNGLAVSPSGRSHWVCRVPDFHQ